LLDLCPDGGNDCLECLPPTYWLNPAGALGQPDSGAAGSPADDVQAFDNGYNDGLALTQFNLALPAGATVRGIAFSIDRAADDDNATDQSIRVLKNGAPVGDDRATTTHWPTTFVPAIYGGASDTWGSTWTATDITSTGFGVVVTPQYLMTAGNDHAQIDSVTAIVYYGGTTGCP
jgi:hypothetical protein